MTFEEANDILIRRYQYHMATIPTDEEIEEAEKAFGIKWKSLCYSCSRYYECCIEDCNVHRCNFFTEVNDDR